MVDRSYGALEHGFVGLALGVGIIDLLVCLVMLDLADFPKAFDLQ